MSAPIHPEVVIPANATEIRRENFREYYARVHDLPLGSWAARGEPIQDVLDRVMATVADYVDAVTRHG